MVYGLGRRQAEDEKDKLHLMAARVPSESKLTRRRWRGIEWANQGETSECVVHGWEHWLDIGRFMTGPADRPFLGNLTEAYNEAKTKDEWEGEDYDGTSVRAGAKVLRDRGLIKEFDWAWELGPVVSAVLEFGPVVVGTNWYLDMYWPDPNGGMSLTGPLVGGHAYVLDGIDTDQRIFRAKNSWGRDWGQHGYFYLTFDQVERLIKEDGEACLAVGVA